MPKKQYHGGFRLTKKQAAALAVQELGTARGLEREPGMPEGYFRIMIGNMQAQIFPDASNSSYRSSAGLIQFQISMNGSPERIVQFFWPDTLEQNFRYEEDVYRRVTRREALEDWIERDARRNATRKLIGCGG